MRLFFKLLENWRKKESLNAAKSLFKNAARPYFIQKVLEKAYPTGRNIDEDLINLSNQRRRVVMLRNSTQSSVVTRENIAKTKNPTQ